MCLWMEWVITLPVLGTEGRAHSSALLCLQAGGCTRPGLEKRATLVSVGAPGSEPLQT